MRKIDRALLHYAEKFSHWFQRWTGKDNFWLAWLFFWSFVGTGNWYHINQYIKGERIETGVIILGHILYFGIAFGLFITSWRTRNNLAQFRNELEINMPMTLLRKVSFVVSIVCLPGIASEQALLSWHLMASTCLFHFASCTPLPPGKSRLKEMLSSIKPQKCTPAPLGSPA